MKKVTFLAAAVTLTLFTAFSTLLISCGGSKENDSDSSQEQDSLAAEGVIEEESATPAEPEILEPPFTVLAEMEQSEGSATDGWNNRMFYSITVNKNGTYTFTEIAQTKDVRGDLWEPSWNDTYEGKWVVDYRTVGEENQKVYDLHWPSGKSHLYIPEDGEYIWDTLNRFRKGSWDAVSNLNFNKAIEIVEFTTPVGTKIRKPSSERLLEDRSILVGPDLIGKKYVSSNGETLEFEPEEMSQSGYKIKYKYVADVILTNNGTRYVVSDGGKTITSRYNGDVFTLQE